MRVICVILVTCLAAAGFSARDVSGEWTADVQARGTCTEEIAMVLKAEDGTVTGTVRAAHGEASIASGIIDGDRITFSVVTDFDGHHFTQNYKGTVEGDIIHFSLRVEDGASETSPIRDFDARRVN